MFSISWDKYPEVESLGYMGVLFSLFWRTSIRLCNGSTSLQPQQQFRRVPFFPHLCQQVFVPFLMVAILTGVRWCLVVILIWISWMISSVEHLFTSLLAICMSSLEKRLFMSSAHFLIQSFLSLFLLCVSSLMFFG